ncbi:MAG: NAD-dependent epimerase/dehydratase family protein [Nitrospira sp.]|nr:MAG: NAD-dependent epimerase/dehydratase family protein [Nitrospira sp.]
MKVLVAGAGFIGSHVVNRLLELGHDVSILDRFAKPRDEWGKRVRVFLGDIRDREAVMEAVYQHDGVINLAGILGTMETVDNPHPSVDTNIHGALNIFEGCRANAMHKNGIRGVQIAVGNHFMNNTYSITKTIAERFALMFNKEHKTKIAVVRALNAYGEYQKHKPVRKIAPNFIIRALNDHPIEIYGDGEQIMDMIYVKDVAEILIRALTQDHNCYDTIFEAGTGRRTTVNDIARLVNEITGNKAGIKHLPMRAGEPERSVVLGDPNTLKPLNYSVQDLTPLEKGMELTVQWYRNHYDWKHI